MLDTFISQYATKCSTRSCNIAGVAGRGMLCWSAPLPRKVDQPPLPLARHAPTQNQDPTPYVEMGSTAHRCEILMVQNSGEAQANGAHQKHHHRASRISGMHVLGIDSVHESCSRRERRPLSSGRASEAVMLKQDGRQCWSAPCRMPKRCVEA